MKCAGLTLYRNPCKNKDISENGLCTLHSIKELNASPKIEGKCIYIKRNNERCCKNAYSEGKSSPLGLQPLKGLIVPSSSELCPSASGQRSKGSLNLFEGEDKDYCGEHTLYVLHNKKNWSCKCCLDLYVNNQQNILENNEV